MSEELEAKIAALEATVDHLREQLGEKADKPVEVDLEDLNAQFDDLEVQYVNETDPEAQKDLRDQMHVLKATIANFEGDQGPRQMDSVKRDGHGQIVPDADAPSWEERMAARRAQDKASENAEWAERTEGLPSGFWRDPCGVVRQNDGQIASRDAYEGLGEGSVPKEDPKLKKVMTEMADEAPILRGSKPRRSAQERADRLAAKEAAKKAAA